MGCMDFILSRKKEKGLLTLETGLQVMIENGVYADRVAAHRWAP